MIYHVILNTIHQWKRAKQRSDLDLRRHPKYYPHRWAKRVHCEYLWENRACYNVTQLQFNTAREHFYFTCNIFCTKIARHACMMTSSNGNIFWVSGLLCREFTGHLTKGLVTQSFDVFFDLHLNKQFSKHSKCQWFKKPVRSLWCHSNDIVFLVFSMA